MTLISVTQLLTDDFKVIGGFNHLARARLREFVPMIEPSSDIGCENQETEVNLCVAGAQLAASRHDFQKAKRLYLLALKWAKRRWGPSSPRTAVVIMHLQDLYEEMGADLEADALDHAIAVSVRCSFFKAASNSYNQGASTEIDNATGG